MITSLQLRVSRNRVFDCTNTAGVLCHDGINVLIDNNWFYNVCAGVATANYNAYASASMSVQKVNILNNVLFGSTANIGGNSQYFGIFVGGFPGDAALGTTDSFTDVVVVKDNIISNFNAGMLNPTFGGLICLGGINRLIIHSNIFNNNYYTHINLYSVRGPVDVDIANNEFCDVLNNGQAGQGAIAINFGPTQAAVIVFTNYCGLSHYRTNF
jgi:hypothetical protein